MKRWQTVSLGVIVTVVTLAWALNGNNLDNLVGEFARGRYLYVIPSFALISLSMFLRAARWRTLLMGRIKIADAFHVSNASYLFNAVLPMRLGEVLRSALVTRLKPPIAMFTSLSSVVVERLLDLLAVVGLVVVAVLITPTVGSAVADGARVTAGVAVTGMLVLAVFAANPRLAHGFVDRVLMVLPFLKRFNLRDLMDHILDGIEPLGSIGGFSKAVFWTFLGWVGSIVAGFVLMYVYYDRPTWSATLLMIASASIAIAFPVSVAGVGPFEAAIIAGLTISGMVDPSQGLPRERAMAFAVLIHGVNTLSYAIWGFFGLSREQISLSEAIQTARRLAGRDSGGKTVGSASSQVPTVTVETPVDSEIGSPVTPPPTT